MPELPEVETMVRGLRPALAGRVIERVTVHDPFLIQGCEAAEFERRGRKVEVAEVVRRGKWVVIVLAGHRGLIVIQPRMTGGFWLVKPPRTEHIRLTFRLAKPEATVWYCDTRRLGKIHWYASPEEAAAGVRAIARPRRPGDRLCRSCGEVAPDAPGDQTGAHGSEGACGNRQHLRR